MLASDVNNPEFVGAVDPDAGLYVEFYWLEPVDKWASEEASAKAGKKVVVKGPKQPFVRVMRPGDQTSILETAVREDHKQRWPKKWLYWQMAEGQVNEGENIPGWKLEQWPYLEDKPNLLRELKFARFYTVDQVAGASDAQVQNMGIGGMGIRETARVDLRERVGKDLKDEMARKNQEIQETKERVSKLEALVMAFAPAEEQPPADVDPDEWNTLSAAYKEKHGRNPHPKMAIEKLRAEIG